MIDLYSRVVEDRCRDVYVVGDQKSVQSTFPEVLL